MGSSENGAVPVTVRSETIVKSKMLSLAALLLAPLTAPRAADVPQSVTELWADFDPRTDPLEVAVVRQWKADGGGVRCCI